MADDKETAPSEYPEKVRFNYIKSSSFRTIHADGVIGGVTPRLNIAAAFYSERKALPDQIVTAVRDGRLAEEIIEERVSSNSIIRELEANLIMDMNLAKSLVEWLVDKIHEIEGAVKEAREAAQAASDSESLKEVQK